MSNKLYSFNIKSWAAWGIGELEKFTEATKLAEVSKVPNIKQGTAKLESISPMVKRRMPTLAKYIYDLNADIVNSTDGIEDIPLIYASKNAELNRTFKIIRSFKHDVSPAQFSMSVHNAIAGLLSVITKDSSVYNVIDSMSGTLETAMVEAVSLLNKHKYVKVIYFDEDLPKELNDTFAGINKPIALYLLVEAGKSYNLSHIANENQDVSENFSSLVDFLSNNHSTYCSINHRLVWTWSRVS